jgi:hypothetical protein
LRLVGAGRDAIMLVVNPHNRSALFVLLVAIFALSLAGEFLWLHWSRPSDGAQLPPGDQSAWKQGGVMVTPIEDKPGGLRAGARGYILKGADQAEMLRAIRAVANGEALFSAAIAKRMMNYFAAPKPSLPAQIFPELTDREREILNLLAQVLNNTEIDLCSHPRPCAITSPTPSIN